MSEQKLIAILTPRLYTAISNATSGAIKSWLDVHGEDRATIGSAAKRVTKQIFAVLKDHPDISVAESREAFTGATAEADRQRLRAESNLVRAESAEAEVKSLKQIVLRADASHEVDPPCALCGGPHPFDTSIPSGTWNRVIRARGFPDYLCTTCIVRIFAEAGESFSAKLWSGTLDAFNGLQIYVTVTVLSPEAEK